MAGIVAPTIAGLVVGVAFVVLVSITFSGTTVRSETDPNANLASVQTMKATRLNGSIDFDAGYTHNEISSIGDWRAIDANELNETRQLHRIDDALASCDRHFAHIGYGLGSMAIAVEGKQSDLCLMSILWEVEMGWQLLDCNVPLAVMPDWESWKENDDVPGFEEIIDYCSETEFIKMRIYFLKDAYRVGESIGFIVVVDGISDSHDVVCNNYPPKITIRNDSTGEETVVNPMRASTSLFCSEFPVRFSVDFTFGENREIQVDKAGTYTLIASYDDLVSYDDVKIEKKFIVSN